MPECISNPKNYISTILNKSTEIPFVYPIKDFEEGICRTVMINGVPQKRFDLIEQSKQRIHTNLFDFETVYIIGSQFTGTIYYLIIGGSDSVKESIFNELLFLTYIPDFDFGFGAWSMKKLKFKENIASLTKMLKNKKINYKFVKKDWYEEIIKKYINSISNFEKSFVYLPLKYDYTIYIIEFSTDKIGYIFNIIHENYIKKEFNIESFQQIGNQKYFVSNYINENLLKNPEIVTEQINVNDWNSKIYKNMRNEFLFNFCYYPETTKREDNFILDIRNKEEQTKYFEF